MTRKRGIRLSLFFSVVSFLGILLLMLLTSPIQNVSYALVFFAAFLVLLVSLGHLLAYLRKGEVRRKTRSRIFIFSVFIMLLLMFQSAQSLNWVELLILLLVLAGLLFYSSRRAS